MILRRFQTKNFTVVASVVEDEDLDLSWDKDGETRRGLDSGKYVAFGVVVKVYYQGNEVGYDSLWGCIYESYEAFMDHRECGRYNKALEARGEVGRCGSYFHDLIRGAIADARKALSVERPYIRRTIS